MALTPEQQTRYNELTAAGAPADLASHAVSLIPNKTPTPAPTPAPAPTPQPAPTPGVQADPNYVARYTQPEPSPVVAETEDAIIARKQKAAQAEIDNLNKYYDSLLSEQRVVNEGRDRGTNAISTLTGLAGSTEANVSANQTTKINQKDNEKIQNERAVNIGMIFSKIRESAVEEARYSRLEARQSAQDIQTFKTQQAEKGLESLQNLVAGGVTFEGLMKTNPQAYADLKKQMGASTDEEMKGIFVKNIPKEEIESSQVIDGRLVVAWRNPINNALRIENVDLGLPKSDTGYTQVADAGNYFLFGKVGPDGKWDGDMASTQKINKGLTPDQAVDNQREDAKLEIARNKAKQASDAGADPQTADLVSTILQNPELFNQLTPTQKAKVAPLLNKLGFSAFGKPLSDGAVQSITQTETAIEGIKELKDIVQANEKYLGPVSGFQKLNPYSPARQVQADIDRIRQRVGKALEGGVLRKEDEEKYKKILATMNDTPETAVYKINQLVADLEREVTTYKKNQSLAGRETSSSSDGLSDDQAYKEYLKATGQ